MKKQIIRRFSQFKIYHNLLMFKLIIIINIISIILSRICPINSSQMLVTFHPHLDAFWLSPDTQLKDQKIIPERFFYDQNQRSSKSIYNSMLRALEFDHANIRRFFTSEIFFFKDWYEYLPELKRNIVKKLLNNGNLQILGGWIQNDQATCYYDDIIEQYTVGMNYMYENFDYVNQIAWATDSFGHSHSQAALLNELGFIMQGIERVDQRYIHERDHPLLQFYWAAKSDSNDLIYGGIMTHVRYFLHELSNFRNKSPSNIEAMVNQFRNVTKAMQELYKNPNLFRFLGNDFEEFIPQEFQFLQNIFSQLNKQQQCQAYKYGNPTEQLLRLQDYFIKQEELPVRQYDFIPNWDHDRYWTGFYTTFPILKKQCKDSSRILNVFRRSLLQSFASGKISSLNDYLKKLGPIQQTISEMQHHDGITATAKHKIELDMIKRMKYGDQQLIENFKQLYNISNMIYCDLIKFNNECKLEGNLDKQFSLLIYNFGTSKKQIIEVILPLNKYYEIKNNQNIASQLFCDESNTCKIIFQASLLNYFNTFIFLEKKLEEIRGIIIKPQLNVLQTFGQAQFHIKQDAFYYNFESHEIKLTYSKSKAARTRRNTSDYTKYNFKINRVQYPEPGVYIMENNGKLLNFGGNISQMKVYKGKEFLKIHLKFSTILQTIIRVKRDKIHQLQVKTIYTPINLSGWQDFFLQISSDIIAQNNQFYHDSNGYLVAKRILDSRPDYKYQIHEQDKLNANTYPVTSFIYIKGSSNKLVIANDRAQGGTIIDNSTILMNIERITGDDGKGLGERYQYYDNITFIHKIAITSNRDDLQRRWQKNYDEGLLCFYGNHNKDFDKYPIQPSSEIDNYLKYTVYFLNDHSIVLRIQNLAEFKIFNITLIQQNQVILSNFNLKIPFVDFKQSFLNGLPLRPKFNWIPSRGSNIDIHTNKIINGIVQLNPLQIRSFRIDFSKHINSYKYLQEKIAERSSNIINTLEFGVYRKIVGKLKRRKRYEFI